MSGHAMRDPRAHWGLLSQADRDKAYDNVNAVANSAELIAARNMASAAFRAAHAGHLDLAYGPGEQNKFDLYPAKDPSAPCLMFIHGGYWQRNSREVFAVYAEGALAMGWSAAMPSHTLAPNASLTEIVAEINQAIDWLAREGGKHGIAGPVVLSGWSAGAHLTAMALNHPAVVAGLALSGVYELGPIRDTNLNAAMRFTQEEVERLSPLRLPPVNKPLAIAYGTREVPALVHDSRDLHARRAAAHVPGALIPVAGADHFTILEELRRPNGPLLSTARMMP